MTLRQVIEGGYCIDCGACAAADERIRVRMTPLGDLQAQLPLGWVDEQSPAAAAVCPFLPGEDETAIAARVFGEAPHADARVGRYVELVAAYAPSTRAEGSSGGVVTWLLSRLLADDVIDAAIHVGPSSPGAERFFDYRVSEDAAALSSGSTSFYYPVSMDEVLAIVRATPGRYAITAVPCFHKALRRLRAVDPVLNERIRVQVGIVCGQMKSAHYLDYLASLGGATAPLASACFRRKVEGRPANDYAFEATTVGSATRPARTIRVLNSRIGVNWGMGYFKPPACDFCDDVVAETADVAAMDAWLPRYVGDGRGWSLVVARTQALTEVLGRAAKDGDLVCESVTVADVVESQRGGFNHRQDALPYRLHLTGDNWTPPKRFAPSPALPWLLKIEQRLRSRLRRRSRAVWLATGARGDAAGFHSQMRWDERVYRLFMRAKRRLGRFLL